MRKVAIYFAWESSFSHNWTFLQLFPKKKVCGKDQEKFWAKYDHESLYNMSNYHCKGSFPNVDNIPASTWGFSPLISESVITSWIWKESFPTWNMLLLILPLWALTGEQISFFFFYIILLDSECSTTAFSRLGRQ